MCLQPDPDSQLPHSPTTTTTYPDSWTSGGQDDLDPTPTSSPSSSSPRAITLSPYDRGDLRQTLIQAHHHVINGTTLSAKMYDGLFRYVGFYTTPKDLRSRLHVILQGSLRDLKVDGGVSWEECEFQKA